MVTYKPSLLQNNKQQTAMHMVILHEVKEWGEASGI
jgi:hypothetical protein